MLISAVQYGFVSFKNFSTLFTMSNGHLISVTADAILPEGDCKQLWFCVTFKLWAPFP